MEVVKIIWDFRGEDGFQIAKHHAIHVQEFCEKENIPFHQVSQESINEMWAIAFVTVDKTEVTLIRDALIPHRAELVQL